MTYQVALLNFEGPLDLLLQLVEQSKLEITTIAIASVTDQYLAHIHELEGTDPNELNQFVGLAVRLVHLKSLALLPSLTTPEESEEFQELEAQLEDYRHYKNASRFLLQRVNTHKQSWARRGSDSLPLDQVPLPHIELGILTQAFQQALAKLPTEPTPHKMERSVSIRDMMHQIRTRVQKEGNLELTKVFDHASTRVEIIVAFLAILELVRSGSIAVNQTRPFAEIMLEAPPQSATEQAAPTHASYA